MRDRMERLVILPFSVGCISEASVAVGIPQPRRSKPDTNLPATATKGCKGEEEAENLSGESMKNSVRVLLDPKPNISAGLNRLVKGFKNLSQIFGEKEEELEEEEEEMEMEIGSPTDVQHVTHIGLDGATSAIPSASGGWEHLLCLLHSDQPIPNPPIPNLLHQ